MSNITAIIKVEDPDTLQAFRHLSNANGYILITTDKDNQLFLHTNIQEYEYFEECLDIVAVEAKSGYNSRGA